MYLIYAVAGLLIIALQVAQGQSLTIEECYSMARGNYPLVKQRDLINQSKELSEQNLAKTWFPQIVIGGQATHQSDVTRVPLEVPGMQIPVPSQNQYRAYAEVSQSIFDGGMVRQQKRELESNAKAQESELEVELHRLEERINQLFFGTLLLDAQGKQMDLLRRDIQLGIQTTEAAIANGTALTSSLDLLRAELLRIDQRDIEVSSLRHAYVDMLGALIDRKLDDDITLEIPATPDVSSEIKRPELRLFQNQMETAALQSGLLRARTLPKLSFFLQGGYGRPALNMLSNDPEPYYIGGLRLNWSLSGLYTLRNDKEGIRLAQRSFAVQRETFLLNTNLVLKQQNADIDRYNKLIATDEEIVELRTTIKNTASVQLENGVITASDYLDEVNAEDQARQNKNIHEIQKLMAEYAVATTKGILVYQ